MAHLVALASLLLAQAPTFQDAVMPVLANRCVECHGISKQSGGLKLDTFEDLMAGGKKGPVLTPGKSGESRIIELILSDGKRRMPPKGDRVLPEEVEALRKWIDAGAPGGPAKSTGSFEVQTAKVPAATSPVLALAGTRDGARLAAARGSSIAITRVEAPAGGGAEAWSAETTLEHEGEVVSALAFSPNGKLLASGGFREVLVWDTATWVLARRLGPHADLVLALDFSPDGNLLASGGGIPSKSGEVKIWEPRTGKLMRSVPDAHTDTVFAVAFSPDGQQVATASGDRMAHVFDIFSGRRLARFEGHANHVLGVAFTPDQKRLVSAGADAKVKTWNLETREAIKDWGGHSKQVAAVTVSPDGQTAVTVSGDRTLRIWNAGDGGQRRAHGEAKDYLYAVALFGNGKYVASGGRDRAVRVYDLKDGKLLKTIE